MSPDELGRLVDRHAAALVLFARQWCAAPEDVVQEAFLKLVTQPRPPERVVSWLFRVVRNGAISAARRAARRRRHEAAAAGRSPAWFERSATELDGAAAAAALEGLPEPEREAIVAHLWGGLTFHEVAEVTSTSASTAHRRYVNGLALLRERLGVPCPKATSTRV